MPLHLLGKKSWNVYNTNNIARVRKDEAAAKAREEAEEQRWRDNDAKQRIGLLEGEEPQPIERDDERPFHEHRDARKKRRLNGEDDTDRDLRLARYYLDEKQPEPLNLARSDVVSTLASTKSKFKPAEATDLEPQGMRFRDAAGYQNSGNGPWYAKSSTIQVDTPDQVGRDVWGNEDPRRHEREQLRITTNDPLLAMKRGVKKLRENERDREAWKRQREMDLYEVEYLARRQEKAERQRRDDEERSLEELRLDQDEMTHREDRKRRRHRHSHSRHASHSESRHRRRSRSPDSDHRHHKHYRKWSIDV